MPCTQRFFSGCSGSGRTVVDFHLVPAGIPARAVVLHSCSASATWVNGLYGYLGYMGVWVIWAFGLYGRLGYMSKTY